MKHKEKRTGRIVLVAIATLLVLVATVTVYFGTLHLPATIRIVVLAEAEKALGADVDIKKVSLTLFPHTGISFSGITIDRKQRYPGEDHSVFSIACLHVAIPLNSLVKKRPTIRKVVITHPDIVIETDSAINAENTGFVPGTKNRIGFINGGNYSPAELLSVLPLPPSIKKLVIRDGKLLYRDKRGHRHLTIGDIDVLIEPVFCDSTMTVALRGNVSLSGMTIVPGDDIDTCRGMALSLHHDITVALLTGSITIGEIGVLLPGGVSVNVAGNIDNEGHPRGELRVKGQNRLPGSNNNPDSVLSGTFEGTFSFTTDHTGIPEATVSFTVDTVDIDSLLSGECLPLWRAGIKKPLDSLQKYLDGKLTLSGQFDGSGPTMDDFLKKSKGTLSISGRNGSLVNPFVISTLPPAITPYVTLGNIRYSDCSVTLSVDEKKVTIEDCVLHSIASGDFTARGTVDSGSGIAVAITVKLTGKVSKQVLAVKNAGSAMLSGLFSGSRYQKEVDDLIGGITIPYDHDGRITLLLSLAGPADSLQLSFDGFDENNTKKKQTGRFDGKIGASSDNTGEKTGDLEQKLLKEIERGLKKLF